jgi:hypothetical protein
MAVTAALLPLLIAFSTWWLQKEVAAETRKRLADSHA